MALRPCRRQGRSAHLRIGLIHRGQRVSVRLGRRNGRVPPGGVTWTGKPLAKRAPHSAVASERLAVAIGDSPVGRVANLNATEEPPMTDEMMNVRTFVEKARTRISCAR
jgi:hypothetical protein